MDEETIKEVEKVVEPAVSVPVHEAQPVEAAAVAVAANLLDSSGTSLEIAADDKTNTTSGISADEANEPLAKNSTSKDDLTSVSDIATPSQSESPAAIDSLPRAPSNPKSHPALPRPPVQNTQRPIFHIIAPRGTNISSNDPKIIIPRSQGAARIRHPIPKQLETIRPARLRTFDARPRAPFIRLDKPAVTVPRPRKPSSTPVVNILHAPAPKLPLKQTVKPVSLHHIPPTSGKAITKVIPAVIPPAVAGPSMPTNVSIVRLPPKSIIPHATPAIKRPKTVAFAAHEVPRKKEVSLSVQAMPGSSTVVSSSFVLPSRPEPGPSTSSSPFLVPAMPGISTAIHPSPLGTVGELAGPAPERQHRQREAIEYLEEVKQKFDSTTYNTFLDVMKGFKRQDMDTIGVIRRVCYLFASEPSLIAGFNGFLPQGYDININDALITIKDRDGKRHIVDSSVDPNNPQAKNTKSKPKANDEQTPRTFDNAVVFLQALKSRVSRKNYERFLEIIKGCEGRSHMDADAGKKMFQEVAQVLENDEDLLLGFSSFLPEMQQWCVAEFQKKQQYEASLMNKDFYWKAENAMRRLAKTNDENAPGSSLVKYKPFKSRPIKNLLQVLKVSNTEDFVFFNKVREAIDNDRIFDNLCRVLRLYTNNLIDRHELFATCMPFFKGLPLLQAEFKRILGFRDTVVFNPRADPSIHKAPHITADMKAELDFTTLKRNGRSYRLLPEKYRHPKCSGRTRLCQDVLNDNWAIFPSWQSEETTRVSVKKSQFEEFLHRTEDERFEIDMLLQINIECMAALERIKRLSHRNPRYEVDSKYECSSKTLMARAIRRAYGENTQKVLDAMKKNPYLVASTVLNRMKLKQREWKNMENAFKLVWEDQAKKYYQKMSTRKVNHSRKNDNKLLNSNYMLSLLQRLYKKREFNSLKFNIKIDKEKSKIICPLKFNWMVVHDISDLLLAYIKKQAGIPDEEKKRMKKFVRKIMPMVFNYATSDSEGATATNKQISPRVYHCGDTFVHYIHLFQIVASRLSSLLSKSRNYAREETFKFNMLKLRQEIFNQADKRLPEWVADQWDIVEGLEGIAPEKERALDRYFQYMTNLMALLEGKMTLSAYEQLAKKIFEEDCFIALGLDKFLVTMAKVLRALVDGKEQMQLIHNIWKMNGATTRAEWKNNYQCMIQQVRKICTRENVYEIEIFDQKESNNSFMAIRMLVYVDPYADKIEPFITKEWQLFRRSYRQSLNTVKRNKKIRCRFKSKPLFLIRNLKVGWERMGRYDALKEYDFDTDNEGAGSDKSVGSLSSLPSSSDESDIVVPKSKAPTEWPYGKHDQDKESDSATSADESTATEKAESVAEEEEDKSMPSASDGEGEDADEDLESTDHGLTTRAEEKARSASQVSSQLEEKSPEGEEEEEQTAGAIVEEPEEEDDVFSSEDEEESTRPANRATRYSTSSGDERSERSGSNGSERSTSSRRRETRPPSMSLSSESEGEKHERYAAHSPSPAVAGPSHGRVYPQVYDATAITEEECRRRINKFTSIQDYKLLKLEFRSVRIEPVSDTEHDYEEDTIANFGASHMSGSMADRIWWTTVLRTKSRSSSDSDSDSTEGKTKSRQQKRRKIQKPKEKDKEDSTKSDANDVADDVEVNPKKSSPSSSSSSTAKEDEVDPLSELMKPAPDTHEDDTDTEERRGPAPPMRYSSEEEEEEPEPPVIKDPVEDITIEEFQPDDEMLETIARRQALSRRIRDGHLERDEDQSPEGDERETDDDASGNEDVDEDEAEDGDEEGEEDTEPVEAARSGTPPNELEYAPPQLDVLEEDDLTEVYPIQTRRTKSRSQSRSTSHLNTLEKNEEHESQNVLEPGLDKPSTSQAPTKQLSSDPSTSSSEKPYRRPTSSSSSTSSVSSGSEPESKKPRIELSDEEVDDDEKAPDQQPPIETTIESEPNTKPPQSASGSEDEEESEDDEDRVLPKEISAETTEKPKVLERQPVRKKTCVLWMSKELAYSCKSDLCHQMIHLENKTSPNVLYRLGAQNDAKNGEYRKVKHDKFAKWLEKAQDRKSPGSKSPAPQPSEADEEPITDLLMTEAPREMDALTPKLKKKTAKK